MATPKKQTKKPALISSEYKATLQATHEADPEWGSSAGKYANDVGMLLAVTGSETLLDYGCGKGALKEALEAKGIKCEISEYDPGVKGKGRNPARADVVACIDVLEHIEPEALPAVLEHIASLAQKGVFLIICTREAAKELSDGRNAHLIVKNPEWWQTVLDQVFGDRIHYEVMSNGNLAATAYLGDDPVLVPGKVSDTFRPLMAISGKPVKDMSKPKNEKPKPGTREYAMMKRKKSAQAAAKKKK